VVFCGVCCQEQWSMLDILMRNSGSAIGLTRAGITVDVFEAAVSLLSSSISNADLFVAKI
jgi:hypothetical protein